MPQEDLIVLSSLEPTVEQNNVQSEVPAVPTEHSRIAVVARRDVSSHEATDSYTLAMLDAWMSEPEQVAKLIQA